MKARVSWHWRRRRRGSWWVDVEQAARSALDEIGVRVPEQGAAGWVLARYWAKQLQLGGPETYRRAAALWELWWALGNPPEIAALVQLMDAWEEAMPDQREEIEPELSMLARPMVVVAERAIAGLIASSSSRSLTGTSTSSGIVKPPFPFTLPRAVPFPSSRL